MRVTLAIRFAEKGLKRGWTPSMYPPEIYDPLNQNLYARKAVNLIQDYLNLASKSNVSDGRGDHQVLKARALHISTVFRQLSEIMFDKSQGGTIKPLLHNIPSFRQVMLQVESIFDQGSIGEETFTIIRYLAQLQVPLSPDWGRRFSRAITSERVLDHVDNQTLLETAVTLFEDIRCIQNPVLYQTLLERHLLWALDQRLIDRMTIQDLGFFTHPILKSRLHCYRERVFLQNLEKFLFEKNNLSCYIHVLSIFEDVREGTVLSTRIVQHFSERDFLEMELEDLAVVINSCRFHFIMSGNLETLPEALTTRFSEIVDKEYHTARVEAPITQLWETASALQEFLFNNSLLDQPMQSLVNENTRIVGGGIEELAIDKTGSCENSAASAASLKSSHNFSAEEINNSSVSPGESNDLEAETNDLEGETFYDFLQTKVLPKLEDFLLVDSGFLNNMPTDLLVRSLILLDGNFSKSASNTEFQNRLLVLDLDILPAAMVEKLATRVYPKLVEGCTSNSVSSSSSSRGSCSSSSSTSRKSYISNKDATSGSDGYSSMVSHMLERLKDWNMENFSARVMRQLLTMGAMNFADSLQWLQKHDLQVYLLSQIVEGRSLPNEVLEDIMWSLCLIEPEEGVSLTSIGPLWDLLARMQPEETPEIMKVLSIASKLGYIDYENEDVDALELVKSMPMAVIMPEVENPQNTPSTRYSMREVENAQLQNAQVELQKTQQIVSKTTRKALNQDLAESVVIEITTTPSPGKKNPLLRLKERLLEAESSATATPNTSTPITDASTLCLNASDILRRKEKKLSSYLASELRAKTGIGEQGAPLTAVEGAAFASTEAAVNSAGSGGTIASSSSSARTVVDSITSSSSKVNRTIVDQAEWYRSIDREVIKQNHALRVDLTRKLNKNQTENKAINHIFKRLPAHMWSDALRDTSLVEEQRKLIEKYEKIFGLSSGRTPETQKSSEQDDRTLVCQIFDEEARKLFDTNGQSGLYKFLASVNTAQCSELFAKYIDRRNYLVNSHRENLLKVAGNREAIRTVIQNQILLDFDFLSVGLRQNFREHSMKTLVLKLAASLHSVSTDNMDPLQDKSAKTARVTRTVRHQTSRGEGADPGGLTGKAAIKLRDFKQTLQEISDSDILVKNEAIAHTVGCMHAYLGSMNAENTSDNSATARLGSSLFSVETIIENPSKALKNALQKLTSRMASDSQSAIRIPTGTNSMSSTNASMSSARSNTMSTSSSTIPEERSLPSTSPSREKNPRLLNRPVRTVRM